MGKANSKLSPEIIAELQRTTHCVRDIGLPSCRHRAFQRECPNGVLTREVFLGMFESFFPFGDSTAFASHLFRLYDVSGMGTIDFGAYLAGLSVTTRGKMEEKIQWAFRFYDRDGDGKISKADMLLIVDSIYRMMGSLVEVPEDEDTPAKRVDKIFKLIAKEGGEEALTLDEFREGIQADPSLVQALLMYDGVA